MNFNGMTAEEIIAAMYDRGWSYQIDGEQDRRTHNVAFGRHWSGGGSLDVGLSDWAEEDTLRAAGRSARRIESNDEPTGQQLWSCDERELGHDDGRTDVGQAARAASELGLYDHIGQLDEHRHIET